MKKLFLFLLLFSSFQIFSQRGKDGAGNITTTNAIVNIYTPLTANITPGNTSISVGSTSGITAGDLVMIIQMQGASVNAQSDYPWSDPTQSIPADTTMGRILNYNEAGNHEFAQVNSVLSATSLSLDCNILKAYTTTGKTQIIRVPRYSSLTISGAGFITCPAWNGSVGGVAVVEVETNATLSSVPSFSVTGKGFRGGGVENRTIGFGTKYGSLKPTEGAYKGESIAGDTNTYKSFSGVFCRGAIANGGGGGNTENAGGGGGSNGGIPTAYRAFGNPAAGYNTQWNIDGVITATFTSSGGGRGGYTSSTNNSNPSTTPPGSASWAADSRRNFGGIGGRPLDYSTGKIFLGGGGGTGDSNDGKGAPGGNGGGMVYMLCYGNLSGAGTILADGGAGGNATGTCGSADAASGGGGGGTIILNIVGTTNLTASPALFARGGVGGNNTHGAACFNTQAMGPGGGGGGGYIGYTNTLPVNAISGGANGIVSGNASNIATNFPPNGATIGGAGSTGIFQAIRTITATPSTTICVNNSTTLSAGTTTTGVTINWFNVAAGGSPIGTGTSFTTPTYTTPGTYTVYAGFCDGGIYRVPSVINVITGPTLTVNTPSICSGQSATLTASGAATYTWNTGATTSSIVVNPTVTTTYTVTGTLATCSGVKTTTVTLLAAPVLTATPVSICTGQTATLSAGGAISYTWNTGATTSTITVTPTVNTTYTVTGSNGTCSSNQTTSVTVNALPTVSSNTATICAGQSATLTAGGALTYTWSTGATTQSIVVSPTVTTNYTVTGNNGTCSNTRTTTVVLAPLPTVTANSATICTGTSTVLTAAGASSFTWSTGPTTTTISVSPTITTNYTVTGSNGSCTNTRTLSVTVNALPTIVVNSPTLCSGQTATLIASGASTYTWNPGVLSGSSVTVSPTSTITYTVSGTSSLSCVGSNTSNVTVTTTPTVAATSATICPGGTATLVASGATTYTWNPGGITGATFTVSPAVNSTYTVTGANGSCTNTRTVAVSIGSAISIAVNSPSICAGQTATLIASGATTYTWSTGSNSSSITVTPASSTNYTISGTVGSCSGTQTTAVSVNTVPVVSAGNATLCSGNSVTLTATGATSYTWNPGGLSGSSVTVSPTSNQTYTITGASAAGCVNTTTNTVSVTATPTVTIPSATICPGGTATLTASGATTYTWNPGGSTGSTFTTAPVVNTTYTVIGANGSCTNTRTVSVSIGSAISISVNSPTICTGQTATLVASGATTYTWSTGSNSNSITVNPAATTNYTIGGTIGTCSGTQTTAVTVNTVPVVSVANASLCSGNSVGLTAAGASTYTWSPGGLSGNSVTVSPTSNQTYTITGTSSSGCVSTTTASVAVTATPTLATSPSTICTGQTATLTASGATSYTWNPGGSTGNTFTVAPTTSSTYTVTGANSNCISTTTVSVNVGAALSISINSATICSGQSVTLTATSPATTYTWNTGATSSSIIVTPTVSTSYTVNGSSGVCSGSGTTAVVVIAVPNVTLTGAAICSGQTATLTANGASSYTWNPVGTSGSSLIVTPSVTTTYSVTGESSGCSSNATVDVTVTPTPTLTVNSPTICGGSATLTATGATNYSWTPGGLTTSSIVVSPTSTTSYTIDGANGSCISTVTTEVTVNSAPTLTITSNNPIPFCPGSCTDFSVTAGYSNINFDYGDATGASTLTTHCYAASGNYTVTATGTFTSGCTASATTTVSINFLPVNTATFDIVGGTQQNVGVNVSINSFGNSGNWTFGDGGIKTNASDPGHIYNAIGNYCIKMVTPTNASGCKDSLTKCLDIIQPVAVTVPNVFTPNNDGINDVFKVTGTGIVELHCIIVDRWGLAITEWDGVGGSWDGRTGSGVAASPGTYFYVISYKTADGKSELVKGTVTLFIGPKEQ